MSKNMDKEKTILQIFIEAIKESRAYKRDKRRLEMAALDYEAMRNMVNEVSEKNVQIEINRPDGHQIVIKPMTELEATGFIPFAEKYKKDKLNR